MVQMLGADTLWAASIVASYLFLSSFFLTNLVAHAAPTSPMVPGSPNSLSLPASQVSSGSSVSADVSISADPTQKLFDPSFEVQYTCKSVGRGSATSSQKQKRVNNAHHPDLKGVGSELGRELLRGGCFWRDLTLVGWWEAQELAVRYGQWVGTFEQEPLDIEDSPYWTREENSPGTVLSNYLSSPQFQTAYSRLLVTSGNPQLFPQGPNIWISLTNDKVGPREALKIATNARYDFVINAIDRVVVITSFKSPQMYAFDALLSTRHNPSPADRAALRQQLAIPNSLSDVLAAEWATKVSWKYRSVYWALFSMSSFGLTASVRQIRYIFVPDIGSDSDVARIVKQCIMDQFHHQNIPLWPGVQYTPDDECFLYLLGSHSLGAELAAFLAQHKLSFNTRTFVSVTVFSMQQYNEQQYASLVWNIDYPPKRSTRNVPVGVDTVRLGAQPGLGQAGPSTWAAGRQGQA